MSGFSEDLSDPRYGRIKDDINNLLTGALSTVNLTEEGALRKIRQHCAGEWGAEKVDEVARTMPLWKVRFPKAKAPAPLEQVVAPTEPLPVTAPAPVVSNTSPEPTDNGKQEPKQSEAPKPVVNPYKPANA